MTVEYTLRGEALRRAQGEIGFTAMMRAKMRGVWVCRTLITAYALLLGLQASRSGVPFGWAAALLLFSAPIGYAVLRVVAWVVTMDYTEKHVGLISAPPRPGDKTAALTLTKSGVVWRVDIAVRMFEWRAVVGLECTNAELLLLLDEGCLSVPLAAFKDDELSAFEACVRSSMHPRAH